MQARVSSRIVRNGIRSWMLLVAALALAAPPGAGRVAAQPSLGRLSGPRVEGDSKTAADGETPDEGQDKAERRFPGGAALKTDPELERLLVRAEEFAADGRFDLACILWQKVLDETGDTLMTRDGRFYFSLAEQVEGTLAKLPAEGLRAYRVSADGEAQVLLAGAEGDKEEAALAQVTRRYFVSAHGDDAAYRLACLALDRHDFVGASRLLAKILERHPDPSPPRGDLLLRLAAAQNRVGDLTAARAALEQAVALRAGRADAKLLALVEAELSRAPTTALASASGGEWLMPFGAPHRRGHMASLPANTLATSLARSWGIDLVSSDWRGAATQAAAPYPVVGFVSPYSGPRLARARKPLAEESGVAVAFDASPPGHDSAAARQLVQRWKASGWRPANQLLLADGKIYVKTTADLTCWDPSRADGEPSWRSAWLNTPSLDSMTQTLMNMGLHQQLGNRPVSLEEVYYFGDQVQQSMSISQGVIYNIEGRRKPRHGSLPGENAQAQPQAFQWGVIPRRARKNWLAAYDARTGKTLWHRSPDDKPGEGDTDLGFMAAPAPYGNLLLIPVCDSGAIWIYGMSRQDGRTVWKAYLCDEPTGGCAPWSAVALAVEGRDVYVNCGAGVVFAVDAVGGAIRYAVRYARDGEPNQFWRNQGFQGGGLLDLKGWDEDVVIPQGRALVVLATDHDRLFAIDRRTGDLLWDSPRSPFEHPGMYCLGVAHGDLFVAGKNVARRYDLDGGRLLWETVIATPSLGRGVLTGDRIYLPSGNAIVELDPHTGKTLRQATVSLTTDDPVGNLYSDGERLWVVGGPRVYALTNLEQQLALLDKRIQSGDVAALLDRMRLVSKLGKFEEAVADLLRARDLTTAAQGPAAGLKTLLDGAAEIGLPAARPTQTLELLHAAAKQAADTAPLAKEQAAQLQGQAQVALGKLRAAKAPTPGAVKTLLATLSLYEPEHLFTNARQAALVAAEPADAEPLRAALAGDQPRARLLAAEALYKAVGEAAGDDLKPLLEDASPALRLAAARGLANIGDRAALPALARLLDADDAALRARAGASLRQFTGQRLPLPFGDKPEARAKAVQAWNDWVAANGETAKLTFPLPEHAATLGRTLVSFYGHNKVVELDSDGKERWSLSVNNPWGVRGLPNGHRLISLYAQNSVVEYNDEGKEVWRKDGLSGNPFGAERLENGNTLIACSNSNEVIEVDAAGATVWKAVVTNRPMNARRLENGNTLVACAGDNRVVEVDASGTVVWEVKNMHGAITAERLENGNTLITLMNSGQVVEVDAAGKIVWKRDGLPQPYDAQRLPNGNTIIADNNGAMELAPDGNVVWRHQQQGAASAHRF